MIDEVVTGDDGSDEASDDASFETDLGIVRMHSSALRSGGFSASASHAGSGFASLFSAGGGVFDLHTLSTTSRAIHSVTFRVAEPIRG